jgi:hypothetical protein
MINYEEAENRTLDEILIVRPNIPAIKSCREEEDSTKDR